MFVDTRQVPAGTRLEAEVCIVGAGAAGITLARQLAARRVDVCLLESGGMEYDAATQSLHAAEIVGRAYHDVEQTRLRYFGGTTNHWSGWCSRLDPIDFAPRAFLPSDGWGLTLADLDRYYDPAAEICQLPVPTFDQQAIAAGLPPLFRQPLGDYGAVARTWQMSPPTRFGEVYGPDLAAAPNVRCLLYANVTAIELTDGGGAVDRLHVKTLDGDSVHVAARVFVLATGGIENARLLLQPTPARPQGIGNETDQVGRHFMLHPMLNVGEVLAAGSNAALLRGEHDDFVGGLSVAEAEQDRHRLPNHVVNFIAGRPRWVLPAAVATLRQRFREPFKEPDAIVDDLALVLGDLDGVAQYAYDRARRGMAGVFGEPQAPPDVYTALLRMEQAPNPDSRILLTDERDPLGVRRAAMDWRLAEGEEDGVRRTVQRIAEVIGALSIGRMQVADWLADEHSSFPSWIDGDYHHIGATRMSDTPASGVCDWNGRVHSVANLYMAGSSTFHTGGSANPTLTIVAMALRLGDHLVEARLRPAVRQAADGVGGGGAEVMTD